MSTLTRRTILKFITRPDNLIGITLILGAAIAFVALTQYFRSFELILRIPNSMMLLPGAALIIGIALVASDNLEHALYLEELFYGIERAIKAIITDIIKGRINPKLFTLVISLIGFVIPTFLLVFFQKWHAVWRWWHQDVTALGFSLLSAGVIIATLLVIGYVTNGKKMDDTLKTIFLVVFLTSMLIGIKWAEPQGYLQMSPQERFFASHESLGVGLSYESQLAIYDFVNNLTPLLEVPDNCEGEGCYAGPIVYFGLVALAGAVAIPHFWVWVTIVFGTIWQIGQIKDFAYG